MPDIVPSSPLSVVGYVNERYGSNLEDNQHYTDLLNNPVSRYYLTPDNGDWYDDYQDYLNKFNNARALSGINENTVSDFVKAFANGDYQGMDPGAVQTLVSYYQTEASNNAARDFASRANQIMVEDLKKAGLNPALLGSNPQGMNTVSGSSYSGDSNITTSARDKGNLEYKYKALSVKQMIAATAIAVNGISKVLSSASSLIKPFK